MRHSSETLRRRRQAIELGRLQQWLERDFGTAVLSHERILKPLLTGFLSATGLLSRGRRNAKSPVLRRLSFAYPALPPEFDGFRILHLSDLHLDGNPGLANIVAELVAVEQVDLCVLTGDYRFETHGHCENIYGPTQEVVQAVRANHGVVAVLGNHDYGEQIVPLESMGIRVLMNEGFRISRGSAGLWVAGVDDPHVYGCDDLDAALAGSSPDEFRLLLAHTPELFASADHAGLDLYLCGHTHGGQICLPFLPRPLLLNARCPRSYASGVWQHGRMHGYTTNGVGTSLLDVRYCCPPEIGVLELVPDASASGSREALACPVRETLS